MIATNNIELNGLLRATRNRVRLESMRDGDGRSVIKRRRIVRYEKRAGNRQAGSANQGGTADYIFVLDRSFVYSVKDFFYALTERDAPPVRRVALSLKETRRV